MKSRSPGYQPGNGWALCDRCGFAYRRKQMKKTWDGLFVCKADWEARHPQDFVRVKEEGIRPSGPIRPDDTGGIGDTVDTSDIPSGTFTNET